MLEFIRQFKKKAKEKLHSAVQSLTEPLIDTAFDFVQEKIDAALAQWHHIWKLNLIDSITLETAVLGIALVSHFFLFVNDLTVCVISLLVLGLLARSCAIYGFFFYNFWQFRKITAPFIREFVFVLAKERSPENAVKAVLRKVFYKLYEEKVPENYQKIHAFGSKVGVPAKDELADKAASRFYPPLRNYIVKVLLYEIGGITVFYCIFLWILKQYIFGISVHLGFRQIVFFPFTTVLPALWRIILTFLN
jgi:hypothetical protein